MWFCYYGTGDTVLLKEMWKSDVGVAVSKEDWESLAEKASLKKAGKQVGLRMMIQDRPASKRSLNDQMPETINVYRDKRIEDQA